MDILDILGNCTGISAIVISISVVIGVIAYAIGRSLNLEGAIKFGEDEFVQGIGSVIIIVIILAFLGSMNILLFSLLGSDYANFSCKSTTGGYECTFLERRMDINAGKGTLDNVVNETKTCTNNCHIEIAKSRIVSLFDLARFYAADRMYSAGNEQIISSFTITLKLPFYKKGEGLKVAPLAGLALPASTKYMMFDLLFPLILILKINEMMLSIVDFAIFHFS